MRLVSEWRRLAIALLLLHAIPTHAGEHPPIPATAVCAVCAAHEGSTELETVVEHRDYQGRCFYFCAAGCAKAFDANPAAFVPLALPRPAPAASFRPASGTPVSLESYRGKVVLVDFWAVWCAPCIKALPEIAALHTEFAARDLIVLGVNIDTDAKKRDKFLKKHSYAHPILFDDPASPAWQAFGVQAIPAAFLIDREGRIVQQWTGRVDIAAVRAAVTAALGE